ncbi:BppU family phage baseplate upper protein, partial [Enterococcus hirae]
DTRTPNISQFKYFGEGLKDSNNPNDYSWDITPEYTEKGLNNTVSLTEPQSIEGLKNFEDGIQSKGKSVLTSDDMKTAVYTLTMSDVPDSTITELTGELVRVNNDVTLRCRVNAPLGTKVVFRVREGYRENIEDVWEIPLTAISQADHKNQVAYYAVTEANKREIRLVTVTAGNHFITGGWRTDDSWPTL